MHAHAVLLLLAAAAPCALRCPPLACSSLSAFPFGPARPGQAPEGNQPSAPSCLTAWLPGFTGLPTSPREARPPALMRAPPLLERPVELPSHPPACLRPAAPPMVPDPPGRAHGNSFFFSFFPASAAANFLPNAMAGDIAKHWPSISARAGDRPTAPAGRISLRGGGAPPGMHHGECTAAEQRPVRHRLAGPRRAAEEATRFDYIPCSRQRLRNHAHLGIHVLAGAIPANTNAPV